jgi:hypothetical protein
MLRPIYAKQNAYRVSVGKPGGKKRLGRPTHRWDDFEMYFNAMGEGRALAQDRNRWWTVVNAVTNLRVSYTEYNFSTSCQTSIFSTRATLQGVSDSFSHLCLGLTSGPSP